MVLLPSGRQVLKLVRSQVLRVCSHALAPLLGSVCRLSPLQSKIANSSEGLALLSRHDLLRMMKHFFTLSGTFCRMHTHLSNTLLSEWLVSSTDCYDYMVGIFLGRLEASKMIAFWGYN